MGEVFVTFISYVVFYCFFWRILTKFSPDWEGLFAVLNNLRARRVGRGGDRDTLIVRTPTCHWRGDLPLVDRGFVHYITNNPVG